MHIIINEYGGSDLSSPINRKNLNILATLIKESFKICKIFTEKNLIHSDIKDRNILYQEDKLKIIDFDLMISYKDFNETTEGGSPGYHLSHLFKITNYNTNSGFFEKKILSKYDLFSFFIVIQSYDLEYFVYLGYSGSEIQEEILDYSIEYPNINNFLKKYTTLAKASPDDKEILIQAGRILANYTSRESLAIELTILFLFPPVEEFINIINTPELQIKLNSKNRKIIISGISSYKEKINSLILNNFKNFENIYPHILKCIEQTDANNYNFNLNVFNNNSILQNE